jgi:hypothetical protein
MQFQFSKIKEMAVVTARSNWLVEAELTGFSGRLLINITTFILVKPLAGS